jgi:hypothetical protein
MARHQFSEHAMIEILMLNGFYRMVAYLTNALRFRLSLGLTVSRPSSNVRFAPEPAVQ